MVGFRRQALIVYRSTNAIKDNLVAVIELWSVCSKDLILYLKLDRV